MSKRRPSLGGICHFRRAAFYHLGATFHLRRAGILPPEDGILPSGGGIQPSEGGILPPEGGMMTEEGGMPPSEGGFFTF